MALDLVNIAHTGIARSGIARLNAYEIGYAMDGTLSLAGTPIIKADYAGPPTTVSALTIGGTALVQASAYLYSASGGMSLSGDSNFTAEMIPICNGVGVVEGTTVAIVDYEGPPTTTAAATLSGDASAYPEIPGSASGEIAIGGASVEYIDYGIPPTVTAAIILSGTAPAHPEIPGSFGGITFAEGVALVVVDYSASASGEITASGDAYVMIGDYILAMTGGISTAGAAGFLANFTGTASGSIALSGLAACLADFTGTASGSLDFTGTDDATPEYLAAASGSTDLSGTSVPLPEYTPTFSGGLVLAGDSANALISFNTEAGGTIHLDGTPRIYADYKNVDAFQGGVTVEGVAVSIFTIDRKGLPVFIRRFDGDVRLALNQDGGFLRIRGGQPEMDEGLETAVNISLFSSGDYWGNALAADGEEIGSGFVEALRAPLSNQARLDVIESARSALSWLVSVGIASAVEVSATIPSAGRLDLGIIIRQPEKAPAAFRYTVNWQSQKIVMQEAA